VEADVAVIGGGIVGLAIAREVLARRPRAHVVVFEKEASVAQHQTSHNSGVIHSGVYYAPGSLKATLCVRGAALMRAFCVAHGVPMSVGGKLIVAASGDELPRLQILRERAEANGVEGAAMVGPGGIAAIEPAAVGVAALHVPATAVTDYAEVARHLAVEVTSAGAEVRTGHQVDVASSVDAGTVIVCAGLQSDRLARSADVRIVPFRGSYHHLAPAAADRVRSMIYPVPDPRFPFLGVHFTRHVDGSVSVGPNAVLALARERYTRRAVDRRDISETLGFRGTWAMARRYWRAGAAEVVRDTSTRLFVRDARRYVPSVDRADFAPGGMGIRAQAVRRDGTLVDDFEFRREGNVLHVINAPSPAATASLAIAEHVVAMAGL
jgi:L-2-hydroxyglutarate oxidase LhgO